MVFVKQFSIATLASCEKDPECKDSMCEIDLECKESMCKEDMHSPEHDFVSIWEGLFQDWKRTMAQDLEMNERIVCVLENYQNKCLRIPEAARRDTVDCVHDASLPEPAVHNGQTVGCFSDFYGGSL